MHLILVSNRLATAKTLTVTPRLVSFVVLGFLILVVSTSWFFSSLLGSRLRPAEPESAAAALTMPHAQASGAQDFARGSLNAMAAKLGELQAQIMRLDSLGERLTGLVGIPAPDKANGKPGSKGGQGGPLILDLTSSSLSEHELQRALEQLEGVLEQKSDSLTALESQLLEKRIQSSLLPTLSPIDGRIGSGFGSRSDPIAGVRARHEGIDFVADPGTPVVASAGGVVVSAEFHAEYGRLIEIDHGNEFSSRYAHLTRMDVEPGQIVRRGEQIGTSGNSGRSTGPHLHFEVRFKGVAQNPGRFLRQDTLLAARQKAS
ncbi:MAG: M23 family metallopeptidase [Rhodobacteraceae bacterium]|nr:M23 family metallopeptidase [Paracoccaceae bacterium]